MMNRLYYHGVQNLLQLSMPRACLSFSINKTSIGQGLRYLKTTVRELSRQKKGVPIGGQILASKTPNILAERLYKFQSHKIKPFLFASQKRHISEDRETTALTVWSNIKELKSSPVPALVYGFSGLIPFVSVPAYMTMSQLYIPQMAFAQLAYGAVILSFLGGVRWGFVLPEGGVHKPNWFNLGYSVAPSLVAWVGLMLPYPVSSLCVMTGLVGAAYFDTAIPGYPPWFKGLRFVLSIMAVLSLWTTFMCQFFLKSAESVDIKDKS